MTKQKNGFILIETVLYIGLLSMLVGGLLLASYNVMDSSDATRKRIIVNNESNFILKKINWAITSVDVIHIPASGATATSLSISKVGLPASENPVIFQLNASILEMKRGMNPSVRLNSENVSIADLAFYHVPSIGLRPAAIEVSFLANNIPFQMKKYLRK